MNGSNSFEFVFVTMLSRTQKQLVPLVWGLMNACRGGN